MHTDLFQAMSAYRKRPLDVGDDEEGSAGVSTTTKAVVEAALAEERAAKLAKGGRNTVLPSRELEGKTVRFVADGEDADDVEEGPIKEVRRTFSSMFTLLFTVFFFFSSPTRC